MSKLYNKKEDVKSFVLEKKKQKLPKGLRRETTTGEGANIIKIDNFGLRFGEPKQYYGNVPDGRQALADGGRARDKQPPKTKKYFRSTKSGAGMTKAGVARYRRENPGSKLKTAVTGKVKPGSKAAKRRKSFCARSAGQMKKFPKAAKDPNSRLRQARRRWKC